MLKKIMLSLYAVLLASSLLLSGVACSGPSKDENNGALLLGLIYMMQDSSGDDSVSFNYETPESEEAGAGASSISGIATSSSTAISSFSTSDSATTSEVVRAINGQILSKALTNVSQRVGDIWDFDGEVDFDIELAYSDYVDCIGSYPVVTGTLKGKRSGEYFQVGYFNINIGTTAYIYNDDVNLELVNLEITYPYGCSITGFNFTADASEFQDKKPSEWPEATIKIEGTIEGSGTIKGSSEVLEDDLESDNTISHKKSSKYKTSLELTATGLNVQSDDMTEEKSIDMNTTYNTVTQTSEDYTFVVKKAYADAWDESLDFYYYEYSDCTGEATYEGSYVVDGTVAGEIVNVALPYDYSVNETEICDELNESAN